jgi:hypothetical protein
LAPWTRLGACLRRGISFRFYLSFGIYHSVVVWGFYRVFLGGHFLVPGVRVAPRTVIHSVCFTTRADSLRGKLVRACEGGAKRVLAMKLWFSSGGKITRLHLGISCCTPPTPLPSSPVFRVFVGLCVDLGVRSAIARTGSVDRSILDQLSYQKW